MDTKSTINQERLLFMAYLCLGLSLMAVIACMMSGFGSRLGWWDFRTGFSILKWGGYAAIFSGAISCIGSVWFGLIRLRQGLLISLSGFLISIVIILLLWQWYSKAQKVPPIHDITTDTENPPEFVSILPLRKDAPNTAEYGVTEVAAQQKSGYPDLVPLIINTSTDQTYDLALSTANNLHWKIVSADKAIHKIEATDRTFWFGFIDDIVVQIKPQNGGSRIDVRSVSRVGKSDVGTNACRIQTFFKKMKQERNSSKYKTKDL